MNIIYTSQLANFQLFEFWFKETLRNSGGIYIHPCYIWTPQMQKIGSLVLAVATDFSLILKIWTTRNKAHLSPPFALFS